MSKKIAIVFVALAAVFLIALVVLYVAVYGEYVERGELVSINEATNVIGFPLVNSATNISYYAVIGGLQYSELYMRVTVAAQDITNQANLVIGDTNRSQSRMLSYSRTKINSSEPIPGPSLHWWNKKINWWTPNKITNGYHINAVKNDGGCYIWVDESSGTLFIAE